MESRARTLGIFNRQYYIQRKYQSRMIAKFCLLALFGCGLFCLIFYTSLNREINGGYAGALAALRSLKSGIISNFMTIEGVVIVVMAVGVVLLTLLMSHRIAGPLWRLEQTAKAIGSGDLTVHVRLREKDEIKTLADQMNMMVNRLGARVREIDNEYNQMLRDISELRECIEKDEVATDRALVTARKILLRNSELLSRLSEIKTA